MWAGVCVHVWPSGRQTPGLLSRLSCLSFFGSKKKKKGGECNKNERADKNEERPIAIQDRCGPLCMLVGVVWVWVCVRVFCGVL